MAVSSSFKVNTSFIDFLLNQEDPLRETFLSQATQMIQDGFDKLLHAFQTPAFLNSNLCIQGLDSLAKEYLNLIQNSNLNFLPLSEYKSPGLPLDDESVKRTNLFADKLFVTVCSELLDENGNLREEIIRAFNLEKLKFEDQLTCRNCFLSGFAFGIILLMQTESFNNVYNSWVDMAEKKYKHIRKNSVYRERCAKGSYPHHVKHAVDSIFTCYQDPFFLEDRVNHYLIYKSFDKDPNNFKNKIIGYLEDLNNAVIALANDEHTVGGNNYIKSMRLAIVTLMEEIKKAGTRVPMNFSLIRAEINNMKTLTRRVKTALGGNNEFWTSGADAFNAISRNLVGTPVEISEQVKYSQKIERILDIFYVLFSRLHEQQNFDVPPSMVA